MKGYNQKDKQQKSPKSTSSASNLIINILLILLVVFAGFLSWSIYSKIKSRPKSEVLTESKKVAAAIIQLEVLNGCGASGAADKFTDYLRKNNFDVVQSGNYITFDVDKSMVIDRIGNRANAEKVAASLGIDKKNIVQQLNNDYFLDISLVIGKDFNQLKPFTN